MFVGRFTQQIEHLIQYIALNKLSVAHFSTKQYKHKQAWIYDKQNDFKNFHKKDILPGKIKFNKLNANQITI